MRPQCSRGRTIARRPDLDRLEDRRLLSTAAPSTGQFQVQPTSSLEESPPAVAIVIETGLDEKTSGEADVPLGDQPYVVAAW
jgi:hypothetical protein